MANKEKFLNNIKRIKQNRILYDTKENFCVEEVENKFSLTNNINFSTRISIKDFIKLTKIICLLFVN